MKKKLIAAGAASVMLAAMPVVGVFAADADVRKSTDTLNVTVNDTCKITSTYATGTDGAWGTEADGTANVSPVYQTKTNTWTVSMDNSASKTSPAHTIAIFCNNTKGWDLNAQNAANLSTTGGDTIAYTTTATADSVEGYYVSVAESTTTDADAAISNTNVTDGKMKDLSGGAGSIYSKAPVTGGHTGATSTASIDVTYTVATIATTEAGTYTGDVVYTLVPKAE